MSAPRAASSALFISRRLRLLHTGSPLHIDGKMWFSGRGGGFVPGRAFRSGSIIRGKHQQRRQLPKQQVGGGQESSSWAREGWAFFRDLTWLACVYHCLTEYVGEPCAVRGPSMRPTIEDGSWLLVDKRGGRSEELELGQIVLVQSPREAGRMVVKRITGLPGDSIRVRPPTRDVRNSSGIEKRLEVVPEGHVWLTGDNSDNSNDSRHYGSVPRALVEGVVLLRLWPYKDFGFIRPRTTQ